MEMEQCKPYLWPSLNRINIVDKYPVKEYSALALEGGNIVLCIKNEGAFLTLRYKEDLENLKQLLNKIQIIEVFEDDK